MALTQRQKEYLLSAIGDRDVVDAISNIIDDKEDLEPVYSFDKSKMTGQIKHFASEFKEAIQILDKKSTEQQSIGSSNKNLISLADKVDRLMAAMLELANKLDSENVTNLDTDYESKVKTKLFG